MTKSDLYTQLSNEFNITRSVIKQLLFAILYNSNTPRQFENEDDLLNHCRLILKQLGYQIKKGVDE